MNAGTGPEPDYDDELSALLLTIARRPDVWSVSCQFRDWHLWQGLLAEQQRRSRLSGLPPALVFHLSGPDSGLPGISRYWGGCDDIGDPPAEEQFTGDSLEERMGGFIHIPWEGVCGADLLVYPHWRRIQPERWQQPDAWLGSATFGLRCNYLLIDRDLGLAPCVERTGPVDGWWLYRNTGRRRDCSISRLW